MRQFGILVAVCAAGWLYAAANAVSAETAAHDHDDQGVIEMELATHQRTLSQQIPKAACFGTQLADKVAPVSELRDAFIEFEKVMNALTVGSAEYGTRPETHDDANALLSQAMLHWKVYRDAFGLIADGKASAVDVSKLPAVQTESTPLLLAFEDYVLHKTAEDVPDGTVSPALLQAIDVIGRQRMLSQKMSKEFCSVVAGVNTSTSRALLKGTLALAESAHNEVLEQLPKLGLKSEAFTGIKGQMEKVDGLWKKFRPPLQKIADGANATPTEINEIASSNLVLLKDIDQAVDLLVTAARLEQ